jgi:hypothetical protein
VSDSERRREIRIESVNLVNYSAEVQADLGGPPEAHLYSILGTARTEDLSAGGCRLITTEEIPAGINLDLTLKLGDHVIQCHGKVVRAGQIEEGWEAGLEFVDLSEMAHDGIKLYLEFKNQQSASD